MSMPAIRRSPSISEFGLLYSAVLLLIVVPMAMIYEYAWGYYSHSVGLEVRTTKPANLSFEFHDEEAPLIVGLRLDNSNGQTILCLNSRPVLSSQLRNTLRVELSRRANAVVYVDGDSELDYSEVVRVIDAAKEAWYGVPVVLLTPELKRTVNYQSFCPVNRKDKR